jgi:hypothetical protein
MVKDYLDNRDERHVEEIQHAFLLFKSKINDAEKDGCTVRFTWQNKSQLRCHITNSKKEVTYELE